MKNTVYGLRTMAMNAGVGISRIQHLIWKKKIKPKKVRVGNLETWVFDEHDQEIIRQHTTMKH